MAQEEEIDHKRTPSQKLWWLILGRLAAALVLFFIRLIWVRGSSQRLRESITLLLFVIGLTVAYSLALRLFGSFRLHVRVQFLIDILLVTWLVWNTGVAHSPYIALYIVIIAVSSLFVGPRDALTASVGCALAFTVSAIAAVTGLGKETSQDLL